MILLQLSRLTFMTVPIIVVFTKFDLFVEGLNKGTGSPESAERYFQENYGPLFETSTKKIAGQVPYTVVASTFYSCSSVCFAHIDISVLVSLPATLQRLVEMTDRSIRVDMPSPSSANPDGKIVSSIRQLSIIDHSQD
jgi:hypothetical protein